MKSCFSILLAIVALLPIQLVAQNKKTVIKPDMPNVQKAAQTALITAKPGDTLFFEAGTYKFNNSLSIDGIENLTLMGRGNNKTILLFDGQLAGSEGLSIKNCDNLTIRALGVEETKGDAIKIQDGKNITLIDVRTEWKGTPDSTNGAYGLYPVTCQNVYIEGCIAKGASDAGIYVGQSKNVIVTKCIAEKNVAGIEIENTSNADVFDNYATNNAGGILVFDLPGLPVKNGGHTRLFKNKSVANNHPNFAPKGNTVGSVPAGTGIIILATRNIEIFENEIENNQTINIAIASFEAIGKPANDPEYSQYPSAIYIHDNKFSKKANAMPDTSRILGQAAMQIQQELKVVPDIIFDGITNPKYLANDGLYIPEERICAKNNGKAIFLNVSQMSTDPKFCECTLKPLEKVVLKK